MRLKKGRRGSAARQQSHISEKLKNGEYLRQNVGTTKWRDLLIAGAVVLTECEYHTG